MSSEDYPHDDLHSLINSSKPHAHVGTHSPGSIGDRRPASTLPEMNRWFSSLSLEVEPSWTPIITRPATSPRPPTIQLPIPNLVCEEDTVFKNDLAHILVWFNEDLTSQQRLSAAYMLAKSLPRWQLDVLLRCFSDVDSSSIPSSGNDRNPVETASTFLSPSPLRSPSKLNNSTHVSDIRMPEPIRPYSMVSSSASSLSETFQSPSIIHDAQASLFYRDLSCWLRYHRLHKYQPILQRIERTTLLTMDNASLENIGICALGARNKFTRLFEMVRDSS